MIKQKFICDNCAREVAFKYDRDWFVRKCHPIGKDLLTLPMEWDVIDGYLLCKSCLSNRGATIPVYSVVLEVG